MKHGIITLTLALLAGLLISSQVMAAGQGKMMGAERQVAAQTGTQTMEQMHTNNQVQTRELNPVQITEMQRLLEQQGYKIGSANGIIGEETMDAIRLYQGTENLTVTGMPNAETLRALAPAVNQQEFFGLAPEFGETNN